MSYLLSRTGPLILLLSAVEGAAHAHPQVHEVDMMTPVTTVEYKTQMDVTGDGRPLALVGGGLTGWISWIPHAEKLSRTRRVARMQPLNVEMGLEGNPLPEGYSVKMEGAALKAAFDEAGWTEPIDLVGWSYGALISLDFALDHPERIRTLTLIEPPALWVLEEGDWDDPAIESLRALELEEDVSPGDLEGFLKHVGLLPPGDKVSELPQWPVWLEHRQSLRMLDVPLSHVDDPARLEAFDRPVLLVTGTGTAAFHRRIQEILVGRLPDARLIELPGGHAPNIVAMDRFLEELTEFHLRADVTGPRASGVDAASSPNAHGSKTSVGSTSDATSAKVHHAVSKDGTSIGYTRTGGGPPVLFVHGTAADHRSWANFASFVEERISLYAMDRRGRGLSGDGPAYHVLREAEDVAAVVDSIAAAGEDVSSGNDANAEQNVNAGEDVYLFGHSYGGLVSLEAALLTKNVKALILYEPPVPTGDPTNPDGVTERLESLVERGELESAMELMLRDVALIPEHELEAYRRTPLWEARIPVAATIPRELMVEEEYAFNPARFVDFRAPTYLLLGSDSPDVYREAVERLRAALPNSEVILLNGQQHLAHHTAPEQLAEVILGILR